MSRGAVPDLPLCPSAVSFIVSPDDNATVGPMKAWFSHLPLWRRAMLVVLIPVVVPVVMLLLLA